MAGIVRNLMVRAVADFSGLQRSMQQAQRDTSNFASSMEKAFGGLKSKLALLGGALLGGEAIKESINDAIELEATTQNLNHILGKSADAYIQWSQTVATSYGFSQVEAERYGASFAHMISLFGNGSEDIRKKTEDLMKMSAIVANGTGRSIDDVMQRIQSGMLGNVQAINDLGIYANQSMLEASKAFQQVAHGRHWADLSMAERQQIIYMSIMEQGAKQYGNTLQNNVHNKLVTFTASLKNLRVALGNAFLPLLNIALPVITKFIQGITTALNYFAAFMRALFGFKSESAKQAADNAKAAAASAKAANATNAQTGAVKKLTQATKDQQKAQMSLAGIDEINTIKSANAAMDGSGGSGVGGGGTGGTGGDIPPISPPDTSAYQAAIDAIEKKVKEYADNVTAWLAPLGPYWDKITKAVGDLWDSVKVLFTSQGMLDFYGWLSDVGQSTLEIALNALADVIDAIGRGIKGLGEAMNGDWTKAWSDWQIAVGDINDAFGIFAPLVIAVGTALGAYSVITGIVKAYEAWTTAQIALSVAMDANPIGLIAIAIGALVAVVVELVTHWGEVKEGFANFGNWFNDNVGKPLGGFIQGMSDTLKGIGQGIIKFIGDGIGDISKWVKTNIVDKITGAFSGMGKLGGTIWDKITSGFGNVYDWFRDNVAQKIYNVLDNWKDYIAGKAGAIWTAIKGKFSRVYDWFRDNVVKAPYNAFINWKDAIASKAGSIWTAIKGEFSGVYTWFKNNVADKIHSAFSGITNGLGSAITSGFKAVYNTGVGFINGFINLLDKLINKLKGVNIFGNKPFGGLPTIPTIPYLAKGGIINNPTLAMVGEAGREAVMPLENNTGWINELADKINKLNGGGSGTTEVILQLNETTLGKAVIGAINKVHRRGGKVLLNV
jgi:hypothetical protein